jgi:hypothetical protein
MSIIEKKYEIDGITIARVLGTLINTYQKNH